MAELQAPPPPEINEWHPHPRQEEALRRIEFEILYGGARGGGKTDAGLVWLTDYIDNPRYRALVIRKNADDLSDWVDRAYRFYRGFGAKIAYRPAEITFPSGAKIKTGHLKDDQAYTKYQGHEYQRELIEELTQIPEEKRYLQLLSSCRSTVPEIRSQVFATTNPGGVGHGWVKRRFVDPSPPNVPFRDPETGRTRIFIPAKVDDNPTLTANDPDYVHFLDGLRSTDVELWKAWRLGDWATFAGQFFKEWRTDLHTCPPFIPKLGITLIGGMDWGRTKPFSFHLSCLLLKSFENLESHEITKFWRVFTFYEAYGTDRTPKEWALLIREQLWKRYRITPQMIKSIQGDPAMFTKGQDNSIAISDQFKENGIRIMRGSNDRVGGWENMHKWLSLAPDGLPYWIISENCNNLIRTLPELIHDDNHVEDVDTEGEDHAGDDCRYMLKRLKWIDGRVGGVGSSQPKVRKMFTAKMDDGKQVAIDLDKFAVIKKKKSVWYPR